MKKTLLSLALLLICSFSAISLLSNKCNLKMNSLLLADVEALAGSESGGGDWGCAGNPTFIPNEALRSAVCLTGGTRLKCKSEDNVCCNPSDQTDCAPIKL